MSFYSAQFRLGVIKSFNPKENKGWLIDNGTKRELRFYKKNLEDGFPEAGDAISFHISDLTTHATVTKVVITHKAKAELKTEIIPEVTPVAEVIELRPADSAITHILTVFHPQISQNENVILSHAAKLEEQYEKGQKFIYWGKIVETTGARTSGITEEWVNKINAEIESQKKFNDKVVKLIVTDFHEVYIAPLIRVIYNNPLEKGDERYAKMPSYYGELRADKRHCEVFFQITDLFKVERDLLLGQLKFQDPVSGEIRKYSPYESNITYPLRVIDENYAFDDGHNFDEKSMSNDKGAHFYDITSNDRSHDEETASQICMNLMDSEAWAILPPLTRTYLLEAEEAYSRAFEKYKNRPNSPVKGFRIGLSYYNALEALLNDHAGITAKDMKAPFLAYKDQYFQGRKHEHKDHLTKDFFAEIDKDVSRFSAINNLKDTAGFKQMMNQNARSTQLHDFAKKLYDLRVKDAHPNKKEDETQYYTFEALKEVRDEFWGINSFKNIQDNHSALSMVNLLMKLYGIYENKTKKKVRKAA